MADWTFREATRADWPAIAVLLEDAGLPLAGAHEHLDGFVLAQRDRRLAGCAALERYGSAGLLRSVAVASEERGRGLGRELVQQVLDRARADGMESVVLLTTTAMDFFPRFGFRAVERSGVPDAVTASVEFREACPASATVMILTTGQS